MRQSGGIPTIPPSTGRPRTRAPPTPNSSEGRQHHSLGLGRLTAASTVQGGPQARFLPALRSGASSLPEQPPNLVTWETRAALCQLKIKAVPVLSLQYKI